MGKIQQCDPCEWFLGCGNIGFLIPGTLTKLCVSVCVCVCVCVCVGGYSTKKMNERDVPATENFEIFGSKKISLGKKGV